MDYASDRKTTKRETEREAGGEKPANLPSNAFSSSALSMNLVWLAPLVSVCYGCIATISPDDRPGIGSVTTTTSTTTTTTTSRICPVDWTYFATTGYCYIVKLDVDIFNPITTWTTAEADCVNDGAHLASIHSQAENDFLYNLAHTGSLLGLIWQPFIGLEQPNINLLPTPGPLCTQAFDWTDATPVDYTNWFPLVQPACVGGILAGCTQMFADYPGPTIPVGVINGIWYQTPCVGVFASRWICKKLP